MRVLIASPDRKLLRQLARLLSSFGYDLVTIADDRLSGAHLAYLRPNILIVDHACQGVVDDAERLLRGCHDRPFCYNVLVYAELTGVDIPVLLESGFDDFIRNPLANAEVLSRLRVAARAIEYETRMESVEYRDGASGFVSRRTLLDMLDRTDGGERRNPDRGSLVAIQCDFIEQLQETFGLAAARQQLCRLADVIRASCQADDVPVRVDPTRYAVWLPSDDVETARAWSDRLRGSFIAAAADESSVERGLTISCAISDLPVSRAPVEAINHALESLALARDNGGNCTVASGDFDAERDEWLQSFNRGNPFAGSVARDLMTPFTLCLAATDTVAEAAARFRRTRLEILPVFDVDGSFVGILREEECVESAGAPMETTENVAALVSREAVSIAADADVAQVMEHFFGLSDEPLVVDCGGEPRGTISHRDFAALVRPITPHTFALRDDDASATARLTVPDTLENDEMTTDDAAHDSAINRFSMRIQTLGLPESAESRP